METQKTEQKIMQMRLSLLTRASRVKNLLGICFAIKMFKEKFRNTCPMQTSSGRLDTQYFEED